MSATLQLEHLSKIVESINELVPASDARIIQGEDGGNSVSLNLGSGNFAAITNDNGAVLLTPSSGAVRTIHSPAYACIAVAHEVLGDASYKIVDGTYYSANTPDAVIRILEQSRRTGERIRIHNGDAITGRDWMGEWDVTGHVSRSTGSIKIPLLISSSRAIGGGGILDSSIVRIRATKGGADLYLHPLYNYPALTIADDPTGALSQSDGRMRMDATKYPFAVLEDGKVNARFETAEKRAKWFQKMGFPSPAAV